MKEQLHELIAIARLRSGRRVVLYQRWKAILIDLGFAAIQAYLERALAHDQVTRDLESQWAAKSSRRQYRADMPALDGRADQILFSLFRVLQAQTAGLADTDPLVVRARQLEQALFPAGVHAITRLAYVDQAVAMEVIVAKLRGPFAGHVTDLALDLLVDRLADVVIEYRQAMDDGNDPLLFAEVQAAHTRGLAYVVEILVLYMAQFHDSDNPDHLAARARFMAPLMEQDRLTRAATRARRSRNSGESEPEATEPEELDELPEELDELPDDAGAMAS